MVVVAISSAFGFTGYGLLQSFADTQFTYIEFQVVEKAGFNLSIGGQSQSVAMSAIAT
jgi:hypothetical protein